MTVTLWQTLIYFVPKINFEYNIILAIHKTYHEQVYFLAKLSLNFVFCRQLAHTFMQPAEGLHPAVGGSILLIYSNDLQISEQCLALSPSPPQLSIPSVTELRSLGRPITALFTTSSCCICHSTCTHANRLLSHMSFMHV